MKDCFGKECGFRPHRAHSILHTLDVINLAVEPRYVQYPAINIKKWANECIATHNYISKLQFNLKEVVPRKIDANPMEVVINFKHCVSMSKEILTLHLR